MEWIPGRESVVRIMDHLLQESEIRNLRFRMGAAQIKAQFPLSYAEAFAAAVALKYSCPLVTGEAEFRSVRGLLIEWVGPA
jgi:predicted nucleic acid-binding protein